MKLSIIIPVYNGEKYIERCLNSIKLDFNYEIIIVDDGSSDNTLSKIKNNKHTHANLTILSQENQKQGAARNNGLKIAKGQYIWFVDADDMVNSEGVQDQLDLMTKNNFDVLKFDAQNFINGNYEQRLCSHQKEKKYQNKELLYENKFCSNVPFHFFSKKFLVDNNLFFLEKMFYEDSEFMLRVAILEPKFYAISNTNYIVFLTEDSSTRNNDLKRKFDLILIASSIQNLFSESRDMASRKVIASRFCSVINTFFYDTHHDKKMFYKGLKKIKKIKNLKTIYFCGTILQKVLWALMHTPFLLRLGIKKYYK